MMKQVENNVNEGKKFDSQKIRMDLLPTYAIEQVAKVLTMGSIKYGDRNWEKGIKWSRLIGSIERHFNSFKQRKDYDDESKLLHLSHLATNALMLIQYHKIYPQGDDRYIPNLKIGLDIDDVLADFVKYYCDTFNIPKSTFWHFDREMCNRLKSLPNEWWLNMPVKILAKDLPFEPHCYITARTVPVEITQKWLDLNDFPQVPVYSVDHNQSKVEVAKSSGIDIFVDDKYENFVDLNNNGICTYLYTTPHNIKYNVGHKRIDNLKELCE